MFTHVLYKWCKGVKYYGFVIMMHSCIVKSDLTFRFSLLFEMSLLEKISITECVCTCTICNKLSASNGYTFVHGIKILRKIDLTLSIVQFSIFSIWPLIFLEINLKE